MKPTPSPSFFKRNCIPHKFYVSERGSVILLLYMFVCQVQGCPQGHSNWIRPLADHQDEEWGLEYSLILFDPSPESWMAFPTSMVWFTSTPLILMAFDIVCVAELAGIKPKEGLRPLLWHLKPGLNWSGSSIFLIGHFNGKLPQKHQQNPWHSTISYFFEEKFTM